jgi:hypothetical protein
MRTLLEEVRQMLCEGTRWDDRVLSAQVDQARYFCREPLNPAHLFSALDRH